MKNRANLMLILTSICTYKQNMQPLSNGSYTLYNTSHNFCNVFLKHLRFTMLYLDITKLSTYNKLVGIKIGKLKKQFMNLILKEVVEVVKQRISLVKQILKAKSTQHHHHDKLTFK